MGNITINAELKYDPKKNGLRDVYIRITQDKKHVRSQVEEVAIKASEWTGKAGEWVSKKNPEYLSYNTKISAELLKYTRSHRDLTELGKPFNKQDINNRVNNVKKSKDFLTYMYEQMEKMKNWNQKKAFNTTKNHIENYTKSKKFSFEDVNKEWLTGFYNYLKCGDFKLKDKVVKLSDSSSRAQLVRVRKLFNDAITDKIIDSSIYPFWNLNNKSGYKMPKVEEVEYIERLEIDELQLMHTLRYDKDDLIYWVHKGFLLAFSFCGMRIEDVMTLKWNQIKNGKVSYNMKKGITKGTQRVYKLKPHDIAMLEEMKNPDSRLDDYILPFLPYGAIENVSKQYKELISCKTVIYNKQLKQIAFDMCIDKVITSHTARHSWAAFTYEKTKDIRLIQENMGHKDIKTTMVYIGKLTSKANDEKLENLYDEIYESPKTLKVA